MSFFGELSAFEILLGCVEIIVLLILFGTLVYAATQFKLARRESEARTRPYLGIDEAKPAGTTNQHVLSKLYIRNFGAMPAVNARVREITLESKNRRQSVESSPTAVLILPGRRNPTPVGISPALLEKVRQNQDWVKLHLKLEYFFGRKQYSYEAELTLTSRGTWEIEKEVGD